MTDETVPHDTRSYEWSAPTPSEKHAGGVPVALDPLADSRQEPHQV